MCVESLDANINLNTPLKKTQNIPGNVVPKVVSINDSLSIDRLEKNQEELTSQLSAEILSIILNDEFVDGMISSSEKYIHDYSDSENLNYIKAALMDLYLSHLDNEKILTGILLMISSISYEEASPQGPIMAMGLLQNKNYGVRDRAIQAFERWNSKKGISVLKSLSCDRRWLQRYVEKVITYLERDGIE